MKAAVPPAAPAVRNTESPVPQQKATKFGDEAFVAVSLCRVAQDADSLWQLGLDCFLVTQAPHRNACSDSWPAIAAGLPATCNPTASILHHPGGFRPKKGF